MTAFGSSNLSGGVTTATGENSCTACASSNSVGAGLGKVLFSIARVIRYRFFIIAGILPYLLGGAYAFSVTGAMNWLVAALGLAGVVSIGLGIEGMNEYFDSRIGGDRVFASANRERIWWHLPLGVGSFTIALIVAVSLVAFRGWPILVFAACGGAMALSYLMPPIHFSYRGLGETVIAVSYGPGLTLGGFYLQTGRLSLAALVVSLVPGLLMFAMALANEVPDYFGDRLVGKKNLIVRLGARNGVVLYGVVMAFWFVLLVLGLILKIFPLAIGLCFLLLPVVLGNVRYGLKHYDTPALYVRVVRRTILIFIAIHIVTVTSYFLR